MTEITDSASSFPVTTAADKTEQSIQVKQQQAQARRNKETKKQRNKEEYCLAISISQTAHVSSYLLKDIPKPPDQISFFCLNHFHQFAIHQLATQSPFESSCHSHGTTLQSWSVLVILALGNPVYASPPPPVFGCLFLTSFTISCHK